MPDGRSKGNEAQQYRMDTELFVQTWLAYASQNEILDMKRSEFLAHMSDEMDKHQTKEALAAIAGDASEVAYKKGAKCLAKCRYINSTLNKKGYAPLLIPKAESANARGDWRSVLEHISDAGALRTIELSHVEELSEE